MADRKISDLTALTTPAAGDYLPIVDISEAAAASKNKRITVEELMRGAPDGTAGAPGFAFESDPNSGIYSPGADQVAISTGGSGRLFVDASGNVILGTTSILSGASGRTLQIGTTTDSASTLQFAATTTGNSYIQFGDGGSPESYAGYLQYTHTDNALLFGTNKQERLRITSAGLVGVGTSAPATALEIKGNQPQLTLNTSTTGYTALLFATNGVNDGGIYYNGIDDKLEFYTADTSGNPQVVVDATGRLGIGTASPTQRLQITDGSLSNFYVAPGYNSGQGTLLATGGSEYLAFATNGLANERARIDSSGRLLVGTSSGKTVGAGQYSLLNVQGYVGASNGGGDVTLSRGETAANITTGEVLGFISFTDSAGYAFGQFYCEADGTAGTNDYPGRLVFSTTADGASSPTEACRINSSQQLLVNTNASIASFNDGRIEVASKASQLAIAADATASSAIGIGIRGNTSTTALSFFNASDGATCGTIVLNSGSTSYNTSSDYRLKENVTPVTDGITRLQQLKPSRFNFIADPAKTVDGFIAHEVQTIVPEAITGEKDAVDDDGNPQYQGIDQSKLVPLLTAALQEAIAKIETLEARLTAAGL